MAWKYRVYPNWEEAAKASRSRRAVSAAFETDVYSKTRKRTEVRRVEIVKPLYGDPLLVYAGTAIAVDSAKVTAKDCDTKTRWRPA